MGWLFLDSASASPATKLLLPRPASVARNNRCTLSSFAVSLENSRLLQET